jgi:hypothetical protein
LGISEAKCSRKRGTYRQKMVAAMLKEEKKKSREELHDTS